MEETIQKPTLCRMVLFTALAGSAENPNDTQEYAGIVVGVERANEAIVDIRTFGRYSEYSNLNVPYSKEPRPNTWRYPPYSSESVTIPPNAE